MELAIQDPPLAARVAGAALAQRLLAPGDRVLVAVSAGADSTALACLLAAAGAHGLPLGLHLAHVDHGWRGEDAAAADRKAVEALAARLGVPLALAPAPPPGFPPTEAAARQWRYRQLSALARAHACRLVATGHHLGDQAETLLMRVLRGAGLVGLAGIPARRPLHPDLEVVRPLLAVTPAALRQWLAERDIPWREDETNADVSRDRARVRARLRLLAARGGDPTARLAALAAAARRRLERRLGQIQGDLAQHFVLWPEAGAVAMPRAALQALRGEDLALALRRAGARLHAERAGPWFTRRHVAVLRGLLPAGGDLDLPRGLRVHVAGKTAWLARRALPPTAPAQLERRDVPAAAFDLAAFLAAAGPDTVALDAGVLGPGARLRPLGAGDLFVPFGSSGAPRQVARWLARHGVPGFVRRAQIVLEGAGGVAWIVGRRMDARHAVTPETRSVAILRVIRP